LKHIPIWALRVVSAIEVETIDLMNKGLKLCLHPDGLWLKSNLIHVRMIDLTNKGLKLKMELYSHLWPPLWAVEMLDLTNKGHGKSVDKTQDLCDV